MQNQNTNTQKRQTTPVGVAGSFINQLMSNNSSLPEVGKGATRLHYSDRTCYEVIEVSKDGKEVKLESLSARYDSTKEGGHGHQNWILEPTGQFVTVVWRYNAWYSKTLVVGFTKEFEEKHKDAISYARLLADEQRLAVYADEVRPTNIVEGITELRTVYHKINIYFGSKDYYYDWSF